MLLREHVAFDRQVATPDGFGGQDKGWEEQFTCRAEFIYSRGSEAVDAARLQGRSIYKVKIRSCDAVRAVSASYRMRDTRRAIEYQIREVDVITDPRWAYLVVESGVAV